MFATATRRAVSLKTGPMSLSAASAQLLPPLPLYRRILRAHRRLPEDMRFMGDSYIKSEYRKTRDTENPLHIIAFLSQWKLYLDEVETQTAREGDAWKGRKLAQDVFDKMSNEQAGQLYELMHATKDVWKSAEQLETEAVNSENEGEADPFKKPQ